MLDYLNKRFKSNSIIFAADLIMEFNFFPMSIIICKYKLFLFVLVNKNVMNQDNSHFPCKKEMWPKIYFYTMALKDLLS